ncbi:MAG TPA: MFS transporter [Candidatus Saccharimonadales bacterium]
MKNTFSSLRIRNFRLYFFGQIISNTGNWLTNVAIILLVLSITHSGLDVGILAACSFGPILLLTAWAGSIVDRSNKRHFLLLTQSLEMMQSFALAILAFMPHPPLIGIYALAILGGMFLAFDNPLRRSFVSEMVPKEEVPNAVVLYGLIVNISRIFGPALAGLLVVTTGFGWCFTLDGLSYIVVILCLIAMRPAELYLRPVAAKTRGAVRAGVQYIKSVPVLWINFVMLLIIGIFSYNFTVTLPLFVTSALHGNTTAFTLLYSIFSLGAVVGAIIIAKRQIVQLKHVIIGSFALGVAMLLLAAVPNTKLATPAIFILGLASILFMTATTTVVQVKTRPEMLGRVLALQTVLLFGTTPIGGPLLGWLSDARGGRMPILLGGIAAVITGIFGYYANKRFVKVDEAV